MIRDQEASNPDRIAPRLRHIWQQLVPGIWVVVTPLLGLIEVTHIIGHIGVEDALGVIVVLEVGKRVQVPCSTVLEYWY